MTRSATSSSNGRTSTPSTAADETRDVGAVKTGPRPPSDGLPAQISYLPFGRWGGSVG